MCRVALVSRDKRSTPAHTPRPPPPAAPRPHTRRAEAALAHRSLTLRAAVAGAALAQRSLGRATLARARSLAAADRPAEAERPGRGLPRASGRERIPSGARRRWLAPTEMNGISSCTARVAAAAAAAAAARTLIRQICSARSYIECTLVTTCAMLVVNGQG